MQHNHSTRVFRHERIALLKTMKTKHIIPIITLLICAPVAQAQIYNTYTNLSATNYYAASATYTYAGSNYLDVSRNTQVGLQFEGYGSAQSSNTTLTFNFRLSRDHTNWWHAPFALIWYAAGTNKAVHGTNVDVGAFGYLQLYSVTSTVTNAVTNAAANPLSSIIKGYRRDQ